MNLNPFNDPAGSSNYRYTAYIIIICSIIFAVQVISSFTSGEPIGADPFTQIFALIPADALTGQYYQFVTYTFLHGGIIHIFFNMFILLIFGSVLERVIGVNRYLTLFILSGIGSALFYVILTGVSNIPLLGASGAIFGVLAAYAVKFPKNYVYIFGFFPMPAWLLIIFLLIAESVYGIFGLQPGIANYGHIGGLLTGLGIMLYWRWNDNKKKPKAFRGFKFVWE